MVQTAGGRENLIQKSIPKTAGGESQRKWERMRKIFLSFLVRGLSLTLLPTRFPKGYLSQKHSGRVDVRNELFFSGNDKGEALTIDHELGFRLTDALGTSIIQKEIINERGKTLILISSHRTPLITLLSYQNCVLTHPDQSNSSEEMGDRE